MAGSLKLEAVVLRSMRFGEADRILHLLSPTRGRVSAIAKGVRRARSRFGGRLEPFSRVDLLLYESTRSRSDLLTVTGADTLHAHGRLREDAGALDAAGRACDAVARLIDSAEPQGPAYNLLCTELGLLDADAAHAGHANQLVFRLKLLLAAGFAPQLGACAACGEREHLSGFSGAAGGVVCDACEASAFPLDPGAHAFLCDALGRPLAQAPTAEPRHLRQAERAIAAMAEHHAGTRLRAATSTSGWSPPRARRAER